jgi:hypothetical protein
MPGIPVAVGILVLFLSVPATAQSVEIAPAGGYRFGGDLFEVATNRAIDLDGARVVGGTVNINLEDGLSIEGLFTRQEARVARIVVDQWLAGGRQEFGNGRARPFLSGLLGLTRYGVEGDTEVRFAVGCAGGVKLALERRLGLRLDARVFTTFVDVDARAAACGPGICVVAVDANVVWQIEFAAGLVVAF